MTKREELIEQLVTRFRYVFEIRTDEEEVRDLLKTSLEEFALAAISDYENHWGFNGRQLSTRQDAEARVKRLGYEPGMLQWKWRREPNEGEEYPPSEIAPAILDALCREGVPAWHGDGVGCVEQMVEFQLKRAIKAEQALSLAYAEPEISEDIGSITVSAIRNNGDGISFVIRDEGVLIVKSLGERSTKESFERRERNNEP
jgi:hypothetical protein